MIKVLFVCHGNICRSAAAEYIFKDLAGKTGLAEEFHVESAATSTEETGNPVYPPMKKLLNANGINCDGHSARQMTKADYDRFDYLVGMDKANLKNMKRIAGGDPKEKIMGLFEFVDEDCEEIADPWYTGNFDLAYEQIEEGCTNLMFYLEEECL